MYASLLALAVTHVLSLPAQTSPHCYEDENGQTVASNGLYIPTSVTSGSSWTMAYDITNVSDVPITVKLQFTNSNGQPYTPYSVSYWENFSGTNTPIDLSAGAVLQPGQLGIILIRDPAPERINVGKMTWFANTCIHEALMVTSWNQYSDSSRYSSGLFYFNGGKPF